MGIIGDRIHLPTSLIVCVAVTTAIFGTAGVHTSLVGLLVTFAVTGFLMGFMDTGK